MVCAGDHPVASCRNFQVVGAGVAASTPCSAFMACMARSFSSLGVCCLVAALPAGGLFELVSCPHYLAEIIIYIGLLIASEGQLMPLLMLVWVVSSVCSGKGCRLLVGFWAKCLHYHYCTAHGQIAAVA